MKKLMLISILVFFQSTIFSQEKVNLLCNVIDKQSKLPLEGATILIKETGEIALSNSKGAFEFKNLKNGKLTLVISYVGYADLFKEVTVVDKVITKLTFELSVSNEIGNELVVSASKRPEKITKAPALILVVQQKDLEQSASFNIVEQISKLQGIEFTRSGVNGMSLNARGFNTAFNAKILSITDGRNSMFAGSSGLPSGIMNTVIKEDVDRIEIVLGPNSALYGPNAHNGIVHTITKDARKWQGTDIVMGAGNQSVFSARFRHASKINNKWAFKITGEYTTGRDFEFYDSVYAGGNIYGPSVAIPERNPNFQFLHKRGEAHLYYNFNSTSDLIISTGGSINNLLGVNGIGRNQLKDYTFSFLQIKYNSPRFFIQANETWTNLGNSFSLTNYTRDYWNRTNSIIINPSHPLYNTVGRLPSDSAEIFANRLGNTYKEESKRYNVEIQYNYPFQKVGLNLITSVTYQKDLPQTFGTILIDANKKIEITQIGAAIQIEKTLPNLFKLVAAARLDNHSLFNNMFSPKLGLQKECKSGVFRLTWGKAFATPIIQFQSGSTFGFIFGNGNGVSYIPNGANITNSSLIQTTTALNPEQISTFELGYKGSISKKLFLDFNSYYSNSINFLSPLITVGGRALSVGDIPISTPLLMPGTVTNNILNGASFSTFFNYGKVKSYGIDIGLNYLFSSNINFLLKYNYFDSDISNNDIKNDANKDGYVSLEERSLNAPKNKLVSTFSFQNLMKGKMYINVSMRFVEKFDMYSGNQIATEAGIGKRGIVYGGINSLNNQPRYYAKNFDWGNLGGFFTFDFNTGYKINKNYSIGLGVSNLFNTTQREFVGSPSIGRLISLEIKSHFSMLK